MKYTSLEQLPVTLCANQVAQVLGISRANAYVLMHSKGFPTIRIGKRMIVPKDKFLKWMEMQATTRASLIFCATSFRLYTFRLESSSSYFFKPA